jgi:hypothetical protein
LNFPLRDWRVSPAWLLRYGLRTDADQSLSAHRLNEMKMNSTNLALQPPSGDCDETAPLTCLHWSEYGTRLRQFAAGHRCA